MDFISRPVTALHGSATVPGDKSISHRALMLGAVAEGETRIQGFLDGADTNATLAAFREMGVAIDRDASQDLTVHGAGLHGLRTPSRALDLGNSGTSARLLAGLLAGQAFDSVLTGDASLTQRPMRRVVDPLCRMGAEIDCSPAGTLPLHIHGGRTLHGIDYVLPVASAQLKSALLLAGLYASGTTTLTEAAITRDHTERMLTDFGCPVRRDGRRLSMQSTALKARDIAVPGDISSAAFLMVAACLVPGADITLQNIGVNPTRYAVITLLLQMGADITVTERESGQSEPVADIRIRHAPLHGIVVPPGLVSVAIDEFPALLIAAAVAEGETLLGGAAELRVKESDRIAAMAAGLTTLGITVETRADGLRVQGGALQSGEVYSYTDHRIAMAFAVAGAAAAGPVRVRDCVNVNTSFPGFLDCVRGLGLDIEAARG